MSSRKIVILVTATTWHASHVFSILTTPYIHRVPMSIVSLPRKVSVRVAVHTPGMMKHWDHGLERTGGRGIVTRRTRLRFITRGHGSNEQGQAARHNRNHHD
jgi:hypothetical protein